MKKAKFTNKWIHIMTPSGFDNSQVYILQTCYDMTNALLTYYDNVLIRQLNAQFTYYNNILM